MAHQIYSAPEDVLIYAVGDVHGQLHLLDDILSQIVIDADKTSDVTKRFLVFVGDYIDRGPDSAGVIERLVSGLPDGFEAHCLMGNHEAILLDFLDDPTLLPHWLRNGAAATLASYGVGAPGEDAPLPAFIQCRDQLFAALPLSHLAFLRGLPLSVKLGDYYFVHAGIRPGVPLDAQARNDALWIRDDFLDRDEDFGCIVVHGHTPGPEPVERRNRIGIDTGAWVYGRLTALRLAGSERAFFHAEEAGAD
ncbi:MAG: serine/threonine protein phosphatase [Hyphomicrobiaceae bacterium]|nr:serine/threonine protein phosphatase [Hyphomicrobiaceae bacterium]